MHSFSNSSGIKCFPLTKSFDALVQSSTQVLYGVKYSYLIYPLAEL